MSQYEVDVVAKVQDSALDAAQAKLDKLTAKEHTIKLGIDDAKFNASSIPNLIKDIERSGSSAGRRFSSGFQSSISNKKNKISFDFDLSKAQANAAKQTEQTIQGIQRKLSTSKFDLDVSNLGKQIKNLEYSLDGSEFKNLESSLKNVNDLSKKLKENFDDNFNLKSNSNINDVIEDYNRLQKAIEKCNNETKIAANSQSGLLKHNEGLIASDKTLSWLNKNTKAVKDYGTALSDLAEKQRNATTKGELQTLNAQVKAIQQEAILAGKTGNSFFSELKRATFQIAEFAGVYGMIQNVVMDGGREMLQSIVDVNSAMIELQKVSSAPQNQINSYFDNATESAVKYGAKISEVIQSTADWSRLGYGLKDAEKLSDVTTLLTNVGDNMTQQKSSEGLISTLKGFNMQASEAESIVDKVNAIANTQPIDTSGIFEGLSRSASSMSAANNTLSETIALITAANSVVQDPASIGTAFKTISMRIRGAKTDLEEAGLETDGMAESTASLREELVALSGVDIMENDTTFKSTYKILDELSTKWQDLTDIQQASVTELIAGKRQGNVVSALMKNFDIARESLDTAENDSFGSANRELEAWNKGIEASFKHFQAQFEAFSNTTLDSDLFKGIVDGGTAALEVVTNLIDKVGLLPMILGGFGANAFFKNLDCSKIIRVYTLKSVYY